MKLNEWMMRFLVLDKSEAESAAVVLSAIIRHDEDTLKRLYEKLGGNAPRSA